MTGRVLTIRWCLQINCYGRKVISQYGGMVGLDEAPTEEQLDPPSPMPWRCLISVPRVSACSPAVPGGWHSLRPAGRMPFDPQDLFPLSDIPSDRACTRLCAQVITPPGARRPVRDRGKWPARAPQLDVSGGGHGRVESETN